MLYIVISLGLFKSYLNQSGLPNSLIQTFIKEIETELGRAIALQNQFLNAPKPKEGGFLGGVKFQAKSLIGGGAEGGGAFGAGALVTRVAGYAAAASQRRHSPRGVAAYRI